MTWEKKRVLVTVKAAPEPSSKHGDCICTAGITDQGEWIRLYPIPMNLFRTGRGFKKFDWIEVECKKASEEEKLGRKESYKIRAESLQVVNTSLSRRKRVDWEERNRILYPLRARSIEDLESAFDDDRTSLGLIRVAELEDFYRTKELSAEEKEKHRLMQLTFDGGAGDSLRLRSEWVLRQIPHIFKYRFRCEGTDCPGHDMTCEDWELFESYRKWPEKYKTDELTWHHIKEKYLRSFKGERDLHFFMGTHSLFPTWIIIGLYYPPRRPDRAS